MCGFAALFSILSVAEPDLHILAQQVDTEQGNVPKLFTWLAAVSLGIALSHALDLSEYCTAYCFYNILIFIVYINLTF